MTRREKLQKLFSDMHLERVICEPDIVSILLNTGSGQDGQRLWSFYKDLKRIDPLAAPAAATSILGPYQSAWLHTCMAPLIMRMTELLDSIPDERARVDEVVAMLELYAWNPGHSTIRHYAVTAAAGAFDYLAFKQSPHLSYLADSIIAKINEKPALVRALLCPSDTSEDADDEVMLDQLRASIERQGDLTAWIKKNIPSKSRPRMNAFTHWPEVMQAMTRGSRGKVLEDDLGM